MSRWMLLGLTALLAVAAAKFTLGADAPEAEKWFAHFKVGQELQVYRVSHSSVFTVNFWPAPIIGGAYSEPQFVEKIGHDYLLIRRERVELKDGKRTIVSQSMQAVPFDKISDLNWPGKDPRKAK